jgi:signal transduction histidine kinase
MGLSIARTFARAQGGDVVYRARVGGGSHFDAFLSVAAAALQPVA